MSIFITGFTLMLGLIVAIGAQNAWLLGMSIRRHYPWFLAVICVIIDSLLMAIGILFFQQMQQWLPAIVPWFTWLGIVMLIWLAVQAALKVYRGNSELTAKETADISRSKAVLTLLAISLLNPHVYLDTVVLVGSIASGSEKPWLFWAGAASASSVWFCSLAAIGEPLKRWLSSPRRWQLFDSFVFVVMIWAAFGLWHSL